MGFFDDSDEEDEPTIMSKLTSNAKVTLKDDEEEDPLDAYMKQIDQEVSEAKGSSDDPKSECTEHLRKRARLDLENDDECSNWINDKRVGEEATLSPIGMDGERSPSNSNLVVHSTQPFRKSFFSPVDTTNGKEWRVSNDTTVLGSTVDPILDFSVLSVIMGGSTVLADTIRTTGFETPTAVQSQTLPVAFCGHDCLVTATTGQGKTMAYYWPLCVHLRYQEPLKRGVELGPLALVIVPTRELANQVNSQGKALMRALGFRSRAIVGGHGKYILNQELKKAGGIELAVATPGRLLDVVSGPKGLNLTRVTMVVLDEADKLLSMGFEDQVRNILRQVRPDRQTLMLSATLGRRIERIAREWLHPNYVRIQVGRTGQASKSVEQHVVVLNSEESKTKFLIDLLPSLKGAGRTLVFVATREACETVAKAVRESCQNVRVDTIHGDKHQSNRTAALLSFKREKIDVLIGTDVAARGLDVPRVPTVVTFDAAKNLDQHVHRVGRVGRLSKGSQQVGTAYILLTKKDSRFATSLRNSFKREGRPVSIDLQNLAR